MYELYRYENEQWIWLQSYFNLEYAEKECDFQESIGYETMLRIPTMTIFS